MWWLLWAVLIVGSLVGAFFLALSLWRSLSGLLLECGEDAERFGAAMGTWQELSDQARHQAQQKTGVSLGDEIPLHTDRVLVCRIARTERQELRRVRHMATWQKWIHFND